MAAAADAGGAGRCGAGVEGRGWRCGDGALSQPFSAPRLSLVFLQGARRAGLGPARRSASGLPMNTLVLFVPQQEAWVVERMGRFHRILEPVRGAGAPGRASSRAPSPRPPEDLCPFRVILRLGRGRGRPGPLRSTETMAGARRPLGEKLSLVALFPSPADGPLLWVDSALLSPAREAAAKIRF